MTINCKFCNSARVVKNGFVLGKQRYKCRGCGRSFREGDDREKYTDNERLKVIKLYLENCGIRTIERLTGFYNNLISHWIKRFSNIIRDKLNKDLDNIKKEDIRVLEIDEMVTYIKKNRKMGESIYLYGLLST